MSVFHGHPSLVASPPMLSPTAGVSPAAKVGASMSSPAWQLSPGTAWPADGASEAEASSAPSSSGTDRSTASSVASLASSSTSQQDNSSPLTSSAENTSTPAQAGLSARWDDIWADLRSGVVDEPMSAQQDDAPARSTHADAEASPEVLHLLGDDERVEFGSAVYHNGLRQASLSGASMAHFGHEAHAEQAAAGVPWARMPLSASPTAALPQASGSSPSASAVVATAPVAKKSPPAASRKAKTAGAKGAKARSRALSLGDISGKDAAAKAKTAAAGQQSRSTSPVLVKKTTAEVAKAAKRAGRARRATAGEKDAEKPKPVASKTAPAPITAAAKDEPVVPKQHDTDTLAQLAALLPESTLRVLCAESSKTSGTTIDACKFLRANSADAAPADGMEVDASPTSAAVRTVDASLIEELREHPLSRRLALKAAVSYTRELQGFAQSTLSHNNVLVREVKQLREALQMSAGAAAQQRDALAAMQNVMQQQHHQLHAQHLQLAQQQPQPALASPPPPAPLPLPQQPMLCQPPHLSPVQQHLHQVPQPVHTSPPAPPAGLPTPVLAQLAAPLLAASASQQQHQPQDGTVAALCGIIESLITTRVRSEAAAAAAAASTSPARAPSSQGTAVCMPPPLPYPQPPASNEPPPPTLSSWLAGLTADDASTMLPLFTLGPRDPTAAQLSPQEQQQPGHRPSASPQPQRHMHAASSSA